MFFSGTRVKTSETGLKKIAAREGTVLRVYKDSKGLPTAGVGHLLTGQEKKDFPLGTKITQAQCDAWLAADLKECEDAVNDAVNTALKQNEFDALISLCFNIGVAGFRRSTVVRKLNAGDKKGAASAILLWDEPPEIRGRRRTEYDQFLTPYKQQNPTAPPTPATVPPAQSAEIEPEKPTAPPAPVSSVESTQSSTQQVGEVVKTEQTTVTQEQPKGDPVDAEPVKVSVGGPLARWLFAGGGLMGLGTAAWGFVQSNLNAVGIGIICVTVLMLAIIFRGAITDAIRMQSASDPDKRNVK